MARSGTTKRTIDHDEIREWIETRDGTPSIVRRSADNAESGGMLRVDFGEPEEALQEISWDEFFRIFDDGDLAFMYQEETADGEQSRFCKFVSRAAEEEAGISAGSGEERAETEEDDDDDEDEDKEEESDEH